MKRIIFVLAFLLLCISGSKVYAQTTDEISNTLKSDQGKTITVKDNETMELTFTYRVSNMQRILGEKSDYSYQYTYILLLDEKGKTLSKGRISKAIWTNEQQTVESDETDYYEDYFCFDYDSMEFFEKDTGDLVARVNIELNGLSTEKITIVVMQGFRPDIKNYMDTSAIVFDQSLKERTTTGDNFNIKEKFSRADLDYIFGDVSVPKLCSFIGAKTSINFKAESNIKSTEKKGVTYVYFGEYPKKEIKGKELTDKIKNAKYKSYYTSEYDDWLIAEIDGEKYIKFTYTSGSNWSTNSYNWESRGTYHYFKFEPIKWKVIHDSKGVVTLMADEIIDSVHWFSGKDDSTYEMSGVRRFLNLDFYNIAFTKLEQSMIKNTLVKNTPNRYEYDRYKYCYNIIKNGVSGGNDTRDKIYVLSVEDINNPKYGFQNTMNVPVDFEDNKKYNQLAKSRLAKYTTYAAARGINVYEGHAEWGTRSVGINEAYHYSVHTGGVIFSEVKDWSVFGLRPVLRMDKSMLQ